MRALVALGCCLAMSAQAEIFDARVIAVMDGDTIMVLREGGGEAAGYPPASSLRGLREGGGEAAGSEETFSHRQHAPRKIKVRLANIDAPEKDQPFGPQSRDSLREMVGRKQVRIASLAVDKYGRTVGLIEAAGLDVNQEQVRRGLAWEYSLHHEDRAYVSLQREARQARRGLWSQPGPVAPWLWRKTHPPSMPEPYAQSRGPGAGATAYQDAACGMKDRCAQMSSCDEAYFYLVRCGVNSLDGNHDGIPCETLCRGGK